MILTHHVRDVTLPHLTAIQFSLFQSNQKVPRDNLILARVKGRKDPNQTNSTSGQETVYFDRHEFGWCASQSSCRLTHIAHLHQLSLSWIFCLSLSTMTNLSSKSIQRSSFQLSLSPSICLPGSDIRELPLAVALIIFLIFLF